LSSFFEVFPDFIESISFFFTGGGGASSLFNRRDDNSFRTDASFSSMDAMAISIRPSGGTTSVGSSLSFLLVVNLVSKLPFAFEEDALDDLVSSTPSVLRTAFPTALTMRPNFPTLVFVSSLVLSFLFLFVFGDGGGLFLFLLLFLFLVPSFLFSSLFLLLSSPSPSLFPPNHGVFVRAR